MEKNIDTIVEECGKPKHSYESCVIPEELWADMTSVISGEAMRTGDIVQSMNGKYIEVVNTDAEGRMALADAITYAIRECGATSLIDVATLTGACQTALGSRYTGVFSNSDDLVAKLVQASILAGENIWRMPLGDDEYKDLNASSVADIANCGTQCGAIAAARFLNEFVERKHPHGEPYFWMTGVFVNNEPEAEDTDHWALEHGYVAVTPTQIDMTAYAQIERLKNWNWNGNL